MTQVDETVVAVCCHEGDAELVRRAMPVHCAHGCPVIILSPEDSPVVIQPHWAKHLGKKAYIGVESWTRQREHLRYLLTFPQKYFLINDADSFCVSAQIPARLYAEAEDTLWSNEVVEPRPHASPYPKIAAQPPYFLTRESIQKILQSRLKVPLHPITPYIDFAMLAWACEAGLKHRAFTELEHPSDRVFRATEIDPERAAWQQLDYRIRYRGAVMMHPIKTDWQLALCRESRDWYEQS